MTAAQIEVFKLYRDINITTEYESEISEYETCMCFMSSWACVRNSLVDPADPNYTFFNSWTKNNQPGLDAISERTLEIGKNLNKEDDEVKSQISYFVNGVSRTTDMMRKAPIVVFRPSKVC